jgi:hypothetical protein
MTDRISDAARLRKIIPQLPIRAGWTAWTPAKDEWGTDVLVTYDVSMNVIGIRLEFTIKDTFRFTNRGRDITRTSADIGPLLPSIAAYMYRATVAEIIALTVADGKRPPVSEK